MHSPSSALQLAKAHSNVLLSTVSPGKLAAPGMEKLRNAVLMSSCDDSLRPGNDVPAIESEARLRQCHSVRHELNISKGRLQRSEQFLVELEMSPQTPGRSTIRSIESGNSAFELWLRRWNQFHDRPIVPLIMAPMPSSDGPVPHLKTVSNWGNAGTELLRLEYDVSFDWCGDMGSFLVEIVVKSER